MYLKNGGYVFRKINAKNIIMLRELCMFLAMMMITWFPKYVSAT